MLKADEVSKYLGRSLTSTESANFDLYLKIATEKVEQLLCFELCAKAGERTYDSRAGYQTLFVDPFASVYKVTYNGSELSGDDYAIKQNDKYSGSWYNSLVFDNKLDGGAVTVGAMWGFKTLPKDLASFLAQMFNQHSASQTPDGNVKSKSLEDFSITYKDTPSYDEFLNENSAVIGRYSLCGVGEIQHGDTYSVYRI
jgi:hypothetical protein